MNELTITMDASEVQDFMDKHVIGERMKKAISRGVRKALAITQKVHKTEVIGTRIGPSLGDVWTKRTGEASRSFHIAMEPGATTGAYGSELARVGVLEMGTQAALGGPLRPRRAKYLAIPTDRARVGVGRAVSPKDWPEGSLVFVVSRGGNPLLLDPRTGEVMFVLRRSVTIPPHPTLDKTIARAQPATDAAMMEAVEIGTSLGTGYL